ncbi:hypothetical protein F5Y17DRAFT_261189 [Xylariaceae sp. FL0594]|nr:hypothetical protein F5Y17DRAFT_261189 [Xylariaceae sp. FL0594]
MYRTGIAIIGIVAGLPSWVSGQESGWAENQVDATMCSWASLRASQLKDRIYMDGGRLKWTPGLADGSYGLPTHDDNPLGYMYSLNLSLPFNASTNVSSILNRLSKAPNGGAANNYAPNYYDGAMLANDDELFLYGGLLRQTDEYAPPNGNEVTSYQADQYGPVKQGFRSGFLIDRLPDGLTRYVTYGGAANSPSENKAWYFGGYTSPSGGPIYEPGINKSVNPVAVSNTLITLDLGTQGAEKWSNMTLPSNIKSRANPSVVWVPVSEQGILVILGGVTYPEYSNSSGISPNEAQSMKDSPSFISDVTIYDIAKNKWYVQPTIAGPPSQLAMGCAVVAPAQDFSSYNIYYYGGFDGIHANEDFNDDVWILSLPSFMWMKVYAGKGTHARAGHQCVTPYPDQMITIGGYRSANGAGESCLDGGLLQVFNLTEAKWLDSYNPDKWNMYGVPEMIHLMIGGDYTGGATMTTPTPTGWATPELASVFATTYPASKITTHYPYGSAGLMNGGMRGPWNGGNKGGTPSWVAPVLGVVLGLVFLTAVVVAILLYRRRKLWWKNRVSSQAATDDHNRVRSWLIGTGGEKVPTVTTEDPSTRFDDMESRHGTPMRPVGHGVHSPIPEMTQTTQYEMPENSRFELMDTSQPIELSGDGLSYHDVITKHTQLHSPTISSSPYSVLKTPSLFTGTVSHEAPSSLTTSQAGGVAAGSGSAVASSSTPHRPDSPSLGNRSSPRPQPRNNIVSDVSRISERDASHLRNLSNGTVSTASNNNLRPSPPSSPTPLHAVFNSTTPPSPPSAALDGHEAVDYMDLYALRGGNASRGQGSLGSRRSTARQSIFRENQDDLGDSPTDPHAR